MFDGHGNPLNLGTDLFPWPRPTAGIRVGCFNTQRQNPVVANNGHQPQSIGGTVLGPHHKKSRKRHHRRATGLQKAQLM
mgnify:CR=1 FL=1